MLVLLPHTCFTPPIYADSFHEHDGKPSAQVPYFYEDIYSTFTFIKQFFHFSSMIFISFQNYFSTIKCKKHFELLLVSQNRKKCLTKFSLKIAQKKKVSQTGPKFPKLGILKNYFCSFKTREIENPNF